MYDTLGYLQMFKLLHKDKYAAKFRTSRSHRGLPKRVTAQPEAQNRNQSLFLEDKAQD